MYIRLVIPVAMLGAVAGVLMLASAPTRWYQSDTQWSFMGAPEKGPYVIETWPTRDSCRKAEAKYPIIKTYCTPEDPINWKIDGIVRTYKYPYENSQPLPYN